MGNKYWSESITHTVFYQWNWDTVSCIKFLRRENVSYFKRIIEGVIKYPMGKDVLFCAVTSR